MFHTFIPMYLVPMVATMKYTDFNKYMVDKWQLQSLKVKEK